MSGGDWRCGEALLDEQVRLIGRRRRRWVAEAQAERWPGRGGVGPSSWGDWRG